MERKIFCLRLPLIALCLLSCTLGSLKAQSGITDSLSLSLSKANDTVNINTILNSLNKQVSVNASGVAQVLENNKLHKTLFSNPNSECLYKRIKARCYDFMDLPDAAINMYFQALECSKKIINEEHSPYINNGLGSLYIYRSDYMKAQYYLLKSIRWFESRNRIGASALPMVNIANINFALKKFDAAEKLWLKALTIIDSTGSYPHYVPMILGNLGSLYEEKGWHDKALSIHQRALSLIDENNDPFGYANTLHNIGVIYQAKREIKKSLAYFHHALSKSRSVGDSAGMSARMLVIGQNYLINNSLDSAEYYLKGALKIATSIKKFAVIKSAHMGLYDVFKYRKDYKTANYYSELIVLLNDSIYDIEKEKIFEEMQTRYETEKKDKEIIQKDASIALSKEENKKKNIILLAVCLILLITAVSFYFIYTRYKLIRRQKQIIENQKGKIEIAYEMLHEKNKEVMDSIHYAARIQRSLITSEKYISLQLKKLRAKKV